MKIFDKKEKRVRRSLDVIKYGSDTTKAPQAGPAEERQALSDWDRLAKAKDQCTYFINEQRLSEIQPQGFKTIDELQDFFKQHLFPDTEHADGLAITATLHFHQAGLPHATNFSIKNISMNNKKMQVNDPETMINFKPTKNGLIITEKNTYKAWLDISGTKSKTHTGSPSKPFRAETETSYLLKHDGSIEVTDLQVKCPSSKLKPIFNPESIFKMLQDLLVNMMRTILRSPDTESSPPPSPRQLG